jgi:class 3 adenylate cyclase/tetratricopeptide (TPR) repeat protein
MFCDLVGSTALSSRLDPEDLGEVIGAFQRCVAETISRFDGFVARCVGDGALIYFGYPHAHEDDAERAARAGLALTEVVGKVGTAERLQVRVGISTGLVVVGDIFGFGDAREREVVGETPNLAARLQAAAEPNTVVIGPETHRLLGDLFEYRDLGEVDLKGFPAGVRAWQVCRESAVASRFEALRATALTPLVGREREFDLLLRQWHQARAGEGRVVLLTGEPGIGKSRLAAALEQHLLAEAVTLLKHSCLPHHQDSAFQPIIAQIERAAGIKRDDAPGVRVEKLKVLLAPTSPAAEDVTLLAELLSIPNGSDATPTLVPQRRKERMVEALFRHLAGLGRHGPVLIVYEDVHWIDPSSREFLDLAVERVKHLPVLLLVTFRPEFHPPWTGQSHATTLTLSRLDQRAGTALVEGVAGSKALPGTLVEEIVARTDGVPLFIEELTKTVLESGLLRRQDGRYVVDGVLPPLAIPTTLHASLMARLDRLSPVKEVAQIGAAIGREFPYQLLSAVARRPDGELQHALDQLVGAGLMFRRGTPPQATYLFKHALVQDAAYSTLLRERRRDLHARIARAIEVDLADIVQKQPELLAHHCTQAGQNEKAIEFWKLAAKRAYERSANDEGIAHVRKALRLLAACPPSAERDRSELDLHELLGALLLIVKGHSAQEVHEAYSRVLALSETLGETFRRKSALFGLARHCTVQTNFAEAGQYGERLLALGAETNDRRACISGHYVLGVSALYRGDAERARENFAEGVRLQTGLRADTHSQDPGVACLVLLGRTLWMLGYPDQALVWSRRAQQAARESGHPFTLAYVLGAAARIHQNRREPQMTRALGEEAIALSVQHGFPFWQPVAEAMSAWAMAVEGKDGATSAVPRIRDAIASRNAMETDYDRPYLMELSGRVLVEAGQAEEARAAVREGIAVLRRTGERHWEPELHRLAGELHRRRADGFSDAESCFTRALVLARQHGARSLELRAATSLARLWRDGGKRGDACDILASVYDRFTEGFDTPDLRDAKALLEGGTDGSV